MIRSPDDSRGLSAPQGSDVCGGADPKGEWNLGDFEARCYLLSRHGDARLELVTGFQGHPQYLMGDKTGSD